MCVRTDNNKNNISSVNILKTDKYFNTDFGEMEKMQKIRNAKPKIISRDDPELDALAVITSQQKKFLEVLNEKMENFHQSHYYKVLFGTTQPAHVISIITVSSVVSLLYSSTTSSQSSGRTQTPTLTTSESSSKPSSTIMIIYLLAFCTHFGSQFWMTFISGLSLYFSLPRHAFGSIQKVLFPKYFSLNAFLSAVTLVVFNRLNYPWNNGKILQEVTLSVCFFLELLVRLYAVPPLLKLISAKTEIELSVGIGQEIGYHDPGPLKNCPHYKRLHKKFRQVHLYVAIGNIIALMCTALHLQYLAYHLLSFSNCQQQ